MEDDMLNRISFRGVIMSGFYLFCLLLPLIAVAQDTSKPGMKVVFLYNEGNGEIKPRCLEIKGRHDFEPRYECYDGKSGELKAFERGEEWTPLAVTPVCFRNQLTDLIKTNCIAYQLKADNTSRYMCFDEEGKKYQVIADRMVHYPVGDRALLDNPHIVQYDLSGIPRHIYAESGWLYDNQSTVLLTGNVRVVQSQTGIAGGASTSEKMVIHLKKNRG